jgi:hypothetical protein
MKILRTRLVRQLAGVATCLLLAAGLAGVAVAPPARAAVCAPWPSCFGTAYQVSGTSDNSLWEWTNDPQHGGSAIRAVPNGYTLLVRCQANDGLQEDGEYNIHWTVPSTTWDLAWDTGLGRTVWVYDWWMNTPPQQGAYNWYSWPDSGHHCNFWNETDARNDLLNRLNGTPTLLLPRLRDNLGQSMDTAKILQVGSSHYIAVYTVNFVVKLAESHDLVNWYYSTDLDPNASQPYLAEASGGSFVLADEAQDSPGSATSRLHFMRYANLQDLFSAAPDGGFTPPYNLGRLGDRFFSFCNEGTPDIHGLSADGWSMGVGFHYLSNCLNGLDQEAFGTLTGFNSMTATQDTVRDTAYDNAGYPGKHGGRDDITWHGWRFSLQEAQNSDADYSLYTTWRFGLYDYSNRQAYPAPIVSSSFSPSCHGNPKVTELTDPNGHLVLLVTAFVFSECAPGQGGELLYTVPAQ